MEEQAATLLQTLKRSSPSADQKLALLNNVKSSIKHLRVPDAAQATIFECVKLSITSQTTSSLVTAGFSTLSALIKRLAHQDQQHVIASHGTRIFPAILDRLGDLRENYRIAASQAFSDFWLYCPQAVEGVIRDGAIAGQSSRAKEMGMLWVAKMSREGLQFRNFVPLMVANLEDPDGQVRDAAKAAIVELFRSAPNHAKIDLKKQLHAQGVRRTIAAPILEQIGLEAQSLPPPRVPAASSTSGHHAELDRNLGDSILGDHPPPQDSAPMDPLNVYSQRELDDLLRDMMPCFEGKEEEKNWQQRDKNTLKLRRLTKGNAPVDYHSAFVGGIKALLEGILKVANSLRTTLSSGGCQLVQELAATLGPSLDSMTEILLQSFIKLCSNTKPITAQNGRTTVHAIFEHATYNIRFLQHISFACQDKNVQPRTCAAEWLRTILRKQAHHKAHFEHTGGLDLTEKCIKRGVTDPNPKVREAMRTTFWLYHQFWPGRAEALMSTMEDKRSFLEKDPGNPNASLSASVSSMKSSVSTARPALGTSRSSLKDTIAAQKKAAAARRMPERPASAMSVVSQESDHSAPSVRAPARPPSAMSSTMRQASNMSTSSRPGMSSNTSQNSLMAAPVRRPKRPEISRPATADPYASRRLPRPTTPSASPSNSPQKSAIKSSVSSSSAAKTSGLLKPHSPTASPAKSKSTTNLRQAMEARKAATSRPNLPEHSSSPTHEETFTLILPNGARSHDQVDGAGLPFRRRPAMDKHTSVDSGVSGLAEVDSFTMILPSTRLAMQGEATQGSRMSPPKRVLQDTLSPRNMPVPSSPLSQRRSPGSAMNIDIQTAIELDRPVSSNRNGEEEVKVWEDPFVGTSPPRPTSPEKPVLEELTLNENARTAFPGSTSPFNGGSPTQLQARQPITPGNEMEVGRSRQQLKSGIQRIKTLNLEAHGFRRVQDLVKSPLDIWGEGAHLKGELLLALLDYLEAPTEMLKVAALKAQTLKTQALATIRAMTTLHKKECRPYLPHALCSVLKAQGSWDGRSYVSAELERTSEEILKGGVSASDESTIAVLDLLESLVANQTSDSLQTTPSTSRTVTASFRALTALLRSQAPNHPLPSPTKRMSQIPLPMSPGQSQPHHRHFLGVQAAPLTPEVRQRLGRVAVAFLTDADADVRRADLEFCLELHDRMGKSGEEEFWKVVGGGVMASGNGVGKEREGQLNLIAYYLARREKQ